ncbi:uncharacterized protein [Henckelia pumila]|uniref:uncharacterized protein n=1 Tax=Henckelia pumila TaxID=405737 RepID=UPI003C6DD412
MAKDCPEMRRPMQGRLFVMQAEETDPDTTLITGRIVVAGVATRALLDSGATHSFFSEAFISKRSIEYEELLGGFTVTIPSGEELSTRNMVKNLELLLQGQSVSADLIVLPMPEFDLILGMDWMTKNAVVIDFQQRSVLVRPEGEEPFCFEATRSSKRTQLISLMQAKKLVHDGCEAFLASVSLTELPACPDISVVDVVRDFEDVFSNEVAGKANVVADALRRKSVVIVSLTVSRPLHDEIQKFGLEFYAKGRAPRLSVQTSLFDRIRVAQAVDEQLGKWRQRAEEKDSGLYSVVDGIVKFRGRFWIPTGDYLRDTFMAKLSGHHWYGPYEALYGRPCRSPELWIEIGERSEFGPEIVQQTAEVVARIHDRMRIAQSRHKSYADHRRRDLEFSVGDHVFIRVAPLKGVMRFEKKGKLAPRVALLPNLAGVHNFYHVSMLRKYISNPSHVLNLEPLQISPHMNYDERPDRILEKQERRLRNKTIPMVKVKWLNNSDEEATWETEADIRTRYPELFGKF